MSNNTGRIRKYFFLSLLSAAMACAHSDTEVITLGSIGTDGSLVKSITIDRFYFANGVSGTISLEHFIVRNGNRGAASRWRTPLLDSYLIPCTPLMYEWGRPDGRKMFFPASNTPFSDGAATWIFEQRNPEAILTSNDGRVFIYKQGRPHLLTLADGTRLKYSYEGKYVTRIDEQTFDGSRRLAERTFNPEDFREELSILGARHTFQYDSVTGLLARWSKGRDSSIIEFDYLSSLLATIRTSGKIIDTYQWASSPGADDYASSYPFPMHLSGDGDNTYKYRVQNGVVFIELTTESGENRAMTINTTFGTISIRNGISEPISFKFDKTTGLTK